MEYSKKASNCKLLLLDGYYTRACLKNHSRNLYAPLCGIFHPNLVAVARYGALIRAKSPTNCDAHLAESLFQTRSRHDTYSGWNMGRVYLMTTLVFRAN